MQSEDAKDPRVLNILSYNIYLLPRWFVSSEQKERANEIEKFLKGYDVVILQEAFINRYRKEQILKPMLSVYPYQTKVLRRIGLRLNGGVIILSKWRLSNEKHIVYRHCSGLDCFAKKGAILVTVHKLGKSYVIAGTHTQAYKKPRKVKVRRKQIATLINKIDTYNTQNHPTILAGDLNVDKYLNVAGEYDSLSRMINKNFPEYIGDFTYDEEENILASGGKEWLDYVLYLGDINKMISYTNRVIKPRTVYGEENSLRDLSDHYAVHGRLVFK